MSEKQVILSGIQPTNNLHLGNYLGAVKNWVALQNQYHCYFCVVDLHSITVRQDPEKLRENTYFLAATYLAAGIDPKKSMIFIQSHIPGHAELTWVLNCFTYMGELNRMVQFKDKSQKSGKNIPAGLFNYPILMAADILLYDAHLVPVGHDQSQHLELTRNVAERMNNIYGKDLFVIPKTFLGKTGSRIMDLQNPENKMSKSDDSTAGAVFISDTDKQIEKKVKRAVTDSGSEVPDKDLSAGLENLFQIQAAITGETLEARHKNYIGKLYGVVKVETAEIVKNAIAPIRDEVNRLMSDKGELDRILARGREKAEEVSGRTLKRVYERIGFLMK